MIEKYLIECGAVKFGKFILTSGKESMYYVDVKKAITNVRILEHISDIMLPHIVGEKIAGMELGAVPIVVAVALKSKKDYVIVRKRERTHGTRNIVEGEVNDGEEFTVIEDVITTGDSVIKSIDAIRSLGGVVKNVIAVVDRQEGGLRNIKKLNVDVVALTNKDKLFKHSHDFALHKSSSNK